MIFSSLTASKRQCGALAGYFGMIFSKRFALVSGKNRFTLYKNAAL
jgi:hypothetical protein